METGISTAKVALVGQKGAALLETVVTLGIVGAVAVIFLTGLAITARAGFVADERATAESLAQSQMEWAKNASYVEGATTYTPAPIPSQNDYTGYSATIAVQPVDSGIQKVTVTVSRNGKGVLNLAGYKVFR